MSSSYRKPGVEEMCSLSVREIILPSVKLTSVTQGRDSGGMIIWIKSELAIELVKRDQYHLWLKIQKGIISASQHVFLCAIYIPPPPLESPYFQEETFQNTEQEISHFQAQGKVLLMGDYARTGKELDFLESHGTRFITGYNDLYPSYPTRENWSDSERSRTAAAAALPRTGSVHRQWKTARRLSRPIHLQLSSW